MWFKLTQSSWHRNGNIFNKNKMLLILSWLVFPSLIWTNLGITGEVGRLGSCLLGSTWAVLLKEVLFSLWIFSMCVPGVGFSIHFVSVQYRMPCSLHQGLDGLHGIVLTHKVLSPLHRWENKRLRTFSLLAQSPAESKEWGEVRTELSLIWGPVCFLRCLRSPTFMIPL